MKKSYFKQLLSVILTLLIVINLVILPIGVSAEEEVQIQYSGKYNAAEYIKAQVDKHTSDLSPTWYPKTDVLWTMETTAIPTDTTSYITDSTEWTTASLKMEGNPFSDTKKGEKYLKPYMYYTNEIHATDKDAIKAGIMSDGQYAGITGGARFGVISSLTFVAPQSGTVKLSDPNGGKFQWWLYHPNNNGAPGKDLGMDTSSKSPIVGLAIYKNNEKIWPSDTAYSSVTGDFSGRTIDFPKIEDIALTKGDKLRMVIITIASGKQHGYYEMNPEITYGADYIETQFNAYEAVKAKQDATTYESKEVFNDSNWSYETRNLEVDSETGYNLPTSADWTQPTLKYYSDGDDQLKEVFPSIFRNTPKGSDYGYGIVTYENKLVTTCIPLMSNASGKVASTITWTASKEGTVRLYDPDSGQIGRLPKETGITQALDSEKNRIGIAIYKNSEQIWPAVDSENSESFGGINYYMLTGDTWEGSTLVKGGRVSVDFPELNDIKVDENDKLRIMIVPLNEDFGYMTLNPQVDYTALADATYANYPLSLQIGDSGKDIKIYEVEQASYAPENIQVNLNTGSGVYPLTRDGADPALSYTMDKVLSDDGSETFKISYNYGAKHFTTNFKVRVVDTVWGDMIMDGKVDASDISAMRQYLLGLSKQSWHTSLSDVNDDALVDVRDLVRIKRYLSDKQNTVIGPAVVTPLVPEENAEPKVITKIEDNSILRLNTSDGYEPYLQYGVQIKPDSIGRTSAEKLGFIESFEIPYLVPNGDSFDWQTTQLPNKTAKDFPAPSLSKSKVSKLKALKQLNKWECKVIHIRKACQEESTDAPYFPALLIAVECRNDYILPVESVCDYNINAQKILDSFADELLKYKRLPKTICVSDDRTYSLLQSFSKDCGVELKMVDTVAKADDIAYKMNYICESDELDSMLQNMESLDRLSVDELKTMSSELKTVCIQMIDDGLLEPDLEAKLKRAFNIK